MKNFANVGSGGHGSLCTLDPTMVREYSSPCLAQCHLIRSIPFYSFFNLSLSQPSTLFHKCSSYTVNIFLIIFLEIFFV